MAFDPVSVTGYNANPPEDDGSEVSTNEISWAKHKEKIGDPLKTAFDALVTELTSTFAELFGVLMAAEGTDLLALQPAAPTGWTRQATHNNKALRLVTGATGGDAGGTTPFTSVFAARTILQANLPSVNLVVTDTRTFQFSHRNPASTRMVDVDSPDNAVADDANTTVTINMAGPASGSIVAALGGSGSAMDFAVQYVDSIWIAKDAL